jgi:hypothetical protein
MKTFFGLMALITGLVIFSGCNGGNTSIEPISLQRLEAAVGEVRKLSDSLSSGTNAEEIRKQSNQAISALRDAVDLFQVKGQSSKALGVDDLGKLVDEWTFCLFLVSQPKYSFDGETAVAIWSNGILGNTLDESSESLLNSKVNKPRMSLYQWQRIAKKYPQTKSLLFYYDRKEKRSIPLPENVADDLIAYEITSYPEGEKEFFDHFEPKYGPDKYCWFWKDGEAKFEMSISMAEFDSMIISEVGKEARKLDLKIKALL